jgi:hypothetical protein
MVWIKLVQNDVTLSIARLDRTSEIDQLQGKPGMSYEINCLRLIINRTKKILNLRKKLCPKTFNFRI